MKYSELRSLSSEERDIQLLAEKENLRKLRFAHAVSPIENPVRIQKSRRRVAQLKTAQRAAEN